MTTEHSQPDSKSTVVVPDRRRLRVAARDARKRARPKPLGTDPGGYVVGMTVEAARHHLHVPGVTGSGKSTWLANLALAEAHAGRGLVVLDCQGDLADNILARLPSNAAGRLVILDPAERAAPPAWNVLAAPVGAADDTEGRERAARMVIETFRKVYAQWWGPRMDETFSAACLTLARRPGSTLAEVISILTDPGYHRPIITRYGEPIGYEGFWDGYTTQTTAQRQQQSGPVISRLREVLSHRFAHDLLAAPAATFDLSQVLDGGILLVRIPKGEIGDGGVQLVGSLLLSGLWQATTGRVQIPPSERADATIIVDECHNFLHLPIGIDEALAEARGYRVSFVLAHQNLGQLPTEVRGAVDANARNKIVFAVSPDDSRKLAAHFEPYFDDTDLRHRDGYAATVRIIDKGILVEPFSVTTSPLPPPIAGRAERLRAAARETAGWSRQQREATVRRRKIATGKLGTETGGGDGFSLPRSLARSLPRSPAQLERGSERGIPDEATSQDSGGAR